MQCSDATELFVKTPQLHFLLSLNLAHHKNMCTLQVVFYTSERCGCAAKTHLALAILNKKYRNIYFFSICFKNSSGIYVSGERRVISNEIKF